MTMEMAPFDAGFPQKLPHYTYVPGVTPHPISDPLGHSHHRPEPQPTGKLTTGLILFNHGFYWEAHEAWEAEWIAAQGHRPKANLIKGFIKLAAAGVKCLEGNAAGAQRHAFRAADLLRQSPDRKTLESLSLSIASLTECVRLAEQMAEKPPLADTRQREAARAGGVPILPQLPL